MLTGGRHRLGVRERALRQPVAEMASAPSDGRQNRVRIPSAVFPAADTVCSEVWYTIVNSINDKVLDTDSTNTQPRACINVSSDSPGLAHCQWEFAIPVVGFPPGWFHMQAVGTGRLLSHDYAHNPPTLLAAPAGLRAPQHRSSWQYQWTLCHSKHFKPASPPERNTWHRTSPPVERNTWHVINRLTRSPLSHHLGTMTPAGFASRDDNLAWRLQLDAARTWTLTNRATGCLLTQETDSGVGCTNRVLALPGGRQSWNLNLLGQAGSGGAKAPML